MNDPTYAYTLAAEPQTILRALVRDVAEFAHLRDARIVCVRSAPELFLKQQKVQAFVGPAKPSGTHMKLLSYLLWAFCADIVGAEDPEFLILFDGSTWDGLDPVQREHLVYHELSHIVEKLDEDGNPKADQDGRAVLQVVFHDYEFFDAEVRRYGPQVCGLDPAAVAIAEGYHRAEQRGKFLRRRSA